MGFPDLYGFLLSVCSLLPSEYVSMCMRLSTSCYPAGGDLILPLTAKVPLHSGRAATEMRRLITMLWRVLVVMLQLFRIFLRQMQDSRHRKERLAVIQSLPFDMGACKVIDFMPVKLFKQRWHPMSLLAWRTCSRNRR